MSKLEIKRAPRNESALELIDALRTLVTDNPDAEEIFAIVKIGETYHRYSTGLTDGLALVAALELAKFDTLSRMRQEEQFY